MAIMVLAAVVITVAMAVMVGMVATVATVEVDMEVDAEDAVEVHILDSAVVVLSPTAEPMPVQ